MSARCDHRGRAGVRLGRGAFTLVELLVVVSIIALLISILLPSLRNAREQAKLVKCLAHTRGMGQATMAFAADHNGRMQLVASQVPVSQIDPKQTKYEYGTQRASDGRREILAWPTVLAQASGIPFRDNWEWGVRAHDPTHAQQKEAQGKVPETYLGAMCPADRVKLNMCYDPQGIQLIGSGDPKDPTPAQTGRTRYWGRLSYAINEDVLGGDSNNGTPSVWKDGCKGETTSQPAECQGQAGYKLKGELGRVHDPGTVALMIDAGPDEKTDDLQQFVALLISAQSNGPFLENMLRHPMFGGRLPTKRHPNGALGVTFADGHGGSVRPVEYVNLGSIRTPKLVISKLSQSVRISPYPVRNYVGP